MKQKNLVLMVVAVGCGLGAAVLSSQMSGKPKIDEVEVIVAVKDLPTGTRITKEMVEKVAVPKRVVKSALPQQYVVDRAEMVGKQLARAIRQGEVFNPLDLTQGPTTIFLEGKDIVSLSMVASKAAAGAVVPGSKVDVLAGLMLGKKTRSFPLLVDMHVLAVNGEPDQTKNPQFPNMSTVSFAVNQEEALLLKLAEKRGCDLSLLLRNPEKPIDTEYDIKQVMAMLEDATHSVEAPINEDGSPKIVKEEPVAVDTVRVLVALEDIAPNTEITRDLVESKLTIREVPKEFATEACTELANHFGTGKVFRSGLARNQWVTEGMIGSAALKPAPQDDRIDSLPKPGPEPVAEVPTAPKEVAPVVPGRPTRDVSLHTASGTIIHRYEEQAPGKWKLIKILSPEQAASKPGNTTEPPPSGEVEPGPTGEKKLD